MKLRDCSRNGAVSARTGLVVVMLSWREVVHLCFLGIGYKEVVVRRNIVSIVSNYSYSFPLIPDVKHTRELLVCLALSVL